MAYAPGISYHGDQYLAQGITSAANSIADTIKKYGEENELVKSYRSVAKNTPGFYDFMGVSKEEMGGMGNKDVIALFKGYATRTAIEDERQKRQFAVNAENRAVDAAQLAARQETRMLGTAEATSKYYGDVAKKSLSEVAKDEAAAKALQVSAERERLFNSDVSTFDSHMGISAETDDAVNELARARYLRQSARTHGLPLPYQKVLEKEYNDLFQKSQPFKFETDDEGNTVVTQNGVFVKFIEKNRKGVTPFSPVIDSKTKKPIPNTWQDENGTILKTTPSSNDNYFRDHFLTPGGSKTNNPTGKGATENGATKNGATVTIYVDEDGKEHIVEQPTKGTTNKKKQ